VYRIVQMHDGVIDVETPEGQEGTRMTIRLPVR
jgi:signal transduction histidine kinase